MARFLCSMLVRWRSTFTVAGLILLGSCASITPPETIQVVNGAGAERPIFVVTYPLVFRPSDRSAPPIAVPAGFVTDLASIPRALWWWQAPHAATMGPAILHDYLYWDQTCAKDEADAIMYLAMVDSGMGDGDAGAVYLGIRTPIAQQAFETNRAKKAGGQTRFITQAYLDRLRRSSVDPSRTLDSLHADAARHNGLAWPKAPSGMKAACAAALKEYQARRSL
jgi:hypothetical protein